MIMNIGIVGVGHIGKILALKLAKAGHEVAVANSRGPEHIDAHALATGAKAVTVEQVIQEKDVIILSIPLNRIPQIAPLLEKISDEVTIIDTSNYYPGRDSGIDSIDEGQAESLWVKEQIGRPFAKAWNAIGSQSFSSEGKPAGSENRIAVPIASDRDTDRKVTEQLVDETGFDAFYTGSLAESWRQQPGAPVYCTDLTMQEMQEVIDTAERERLPKRRDLAVAAVTERVGDTTTNPAGDYGVRLCRALFM